MKDIFKRTLSYILMICMIMSYFPVTSFASGASTGTIQNAGKTGNRIEYEVAVKDSSGSDDPDDENSYAYLVSILPITTDSDKGGSPDKPVVDFNNNNGLLEQFVVARKDISNVVAPSEFGSGFWYYQDTKNKKNFADL